MKKTFIIKKQTNGCVVRKQCIAENSRSWKVFSYLLPQQKRKRTVRLNGTPRINSSPFVTLSRPVMMLAAVIWSRHPKDKRIRIFAIPSPSSTSLSPLVPATGSHITLQPPTPTSSPPSPGGNIGILDECRFPTGSWHSAISVYMIIIIIVHICGEELRTTPPPFPTHTKKGEKRECPWKYEGGEDIFNALWNAEKNARRKEKTLCLSFWYAAPWFLVRPPTGNPSDNQETTTTADDDDDFDGGKMFLTECTHFSLLATRWNFSFARDTESVKFVVREGGGM